jgi:polyferredoxin
MAWGLAHRSPIDLHALRDRNPTYVRLHDGAIRNAYTLKIANRSFAPMQVDVGFSGPPGAAVTSPGVAASPLRVAVAANQVRALRVFVTVPPGGMTAPSAPARFEVAAGRSRASVRTVFLSGGPS